MNKYNKTWWRLRLVRYLVRYKYYGWLELRAAWKASGDDWLTYWESETHPHDAVLEDYGYA